jgi:protein-tyrosine phosphatase
MRRCEIVPERNHDRDGSGRLRQIAGDAQRRSQDLALADGRRIELPGLFNLRDLGGYPSAGGELPWRTLLRSDALHQVDAEGLRVLADLDLRTIIDLRTHMEAELGPSPLGRLNARHVHVSVLGGDLENLPLELDAIYAYVIAECGSAIANAIRPLCSAEAFPALVHCSAGKDRTGIVIAMILSVLGVPDEIIAADYGLSAAYLDPSRTAAIGQLQVSTGLGEKLTDELILSPPRLIMEVLTSVRASHASVPDYLLAHGLRESDLAALRAALAG